MLEQALYKTATPSERVT